MTHFKGQVGPIIPKNYTSTIIYVSEVSTLSRPLSKEQIRVKEKNCFNISFFFKINIYIYIYIYFNLQF